MTPDSAMGRLISANTSSRVDTFTCFCSIRLINVDCFLFTFRSVLSRSGNRECVARIKFTWTDRAIDNERYARCCIVRARSQNEQDARNTLRLHRRLKFSWKICPRQPWKSTSSWRRSRDRLRRRSFNPLRLSSRPFATDRLTRCCIC